MRRVFAKGLITFNQAIALDSTYASPYARLAWLLPQKTRSYEAAGGPVPFDTVQYYYAHVHAGECAVLLCDGSQVWRRHSQIWRDR